MHTSILNIKPLGLLCLFLILFGLSGCGIFLKEPDITAKNSLVKLKVSRYPDFTDHHAYKNLKDSIEQSLVYLRRLPADREFFYGKDTYTAAHLMVSHELFLDFLLKTPTQKELKRFIAESYTVYQSVGSNRKKEVLFTGYYEPAMKGSLTPNDLFTFPVYATPSDLIAIDLSLFSDRYNGQRIVGRFAGKTVVPYYDRK